MTTTTNLTDAQVLRTAFGHFPSGVVAVAATVEGTDHVLVASSFTVGVSLDPPLVLVAVQNTSGTWPALRTADRLGVSVLAQGQEALCRQLAGKDRQERWSGVEVERADGGAVLVAGATLGLECAVHDEHLAGDHTIVVLRVCGLRTRPELEPLVFHSSRFRALT
jgi:flavin reductase (DIM6/NTAB) family NADH-FMN oxidoreductase RutF